MPPLQALEGFIKAANNSRIKTSKEVKLDKDQI